MSPSKKAPHQFHPHLAISAGSTESKISVQPIQQKTEYSRGYRLASRTYQEADTIIQLGSISIGGDSFVIMAGPCAVESETQINACAREVQTYGGHVLRGGCFKARSSVYSFQGLGEPGLEYLVEAGRRFNLPVITEVLSLEYLDIVADKTDIIQIGARNMQNFPLLSAVGRVNKPVMLKRGFSSSIEELLQAVEYILAEGNNQVMLCERGIRTFETTTRATLDISAIPVLRQLTHLPILVDPSHAAGRRDLVIPLSKAAKAVGAHGIIVEIHPNPEDALSDGKQSLYFDQFAELVSALKDN